MLDTAIFRVKFNGVRWRRRKRSGGDCFIGRLSNFLGRRRRLIFCGERLGWLGWLGWCCGRGWLRRLGSLGGFNRLGLIIEKGRGFVRVDFTFENGLRGGLGGGRAGERRGIFALRLLRGEADPVEEPQEARLARGAQGRLLAKGYPIFHPDRLTMLRRPLVLAGFSRWRQRPVQQVVRLAF